MRLRWLCILVVSHELAGRFLKCELAHVDIDRELFERTVITASLPETIIPNGDET